jgi:hypothetical protein
MQGVYFSVIMKEEQDKVIFDILHNESLDDTIYIKKTKIYRNIQLILVKILTS